MKTLVVLYRTAKFQQCPVLPPACSPASLFLARSHRLLAMEALCWLLDGVHKECVWHLRTTLEGAVYPKWTSTPHLCRIDEERRVGHAICIPQSGAVVGYPVGTLLMVALLTP